MVNIRLNKNGWGLMQMLLISGILLILLLFAAYYIYVFYTKLDVFSGSQYATLESKLQVAAIKYVLDNDKEDNLQSVSYELLEKSGYISNFTDNNDVSCNGYVIIGDNDYKTFIKCENYKTNGYKDTYEWKVLTSKLYIDILLMRFD